MLARIHDRDRVFALVDDIGLGSCRMEGHVGGRAAHGDGCRHGVGLRVNHGHAAMAVVRTGVEHIDEATAGVDLDGSWLSSDADMGEHGAAKGSMTATLALPRSFCGSSE